MLRKTIFTSIIFLIALSVFSQKAAYKMLVGTYTNGKSEGIYDIEYNSKGKVIAKSLLAKTDNPSFITFSPDKRFLYAVNESDENSAVSSFSFDVEKRTLTFLNRISLGNAGPCFVTSTQKHVIVANYGNGTISVLERKENGELTDTVQTIIHQKKMFGRGHFGMSNTHQTLFSPNGKLLIANNLGKDCVYSYRYNPDGKNEVLKEIDVKFLEKHSGPRHAVFTKDGKYLYLLKELNAGITVFEVNDDGKLNILQETSIKKDSVNNSGSDIHLSPDEKFLYAANRADVNEINCFKVGDDHKIAKKSSVSTGGKAPRNFAISSDGKFVFVGNQKTDNITIFNRDKKSGKLKPLKESVELGAPVCLLFY